MTPATLAIMRVVGDAAYADLESAKRLAPPHGAIGVGSADFDYTLRAEVQLEYLRAVRLGKTFGEALDAAKLLGREMVEKWNARGSKARVSITGNYELHRNTCTVDAIAETVHRQFLAPQFIPEFRLQQVAKVYAHDVRTESQAAKPTAYSKGESMPETTTPETKAETLPYVDIPHDMADMLADGGMVIKSRIPTLAALRIIPQGNGRCYAIACDGAGASVVEIDGTFTRPVSIPREVLPSKKSQWPKDGSAHRVTLHADTGEAPPALRCDWPIQPGETMRKYSAAHEPQGAYPPLVAGDAIRSFNGRPVFVLSLDPGLLFDVAQACGRTDDAATVHLVIDFDDPKASVGVLSATGHIGVIMPCGVKSLDVAKIGERDAQLVAEYQAKVELLALCEKAYGVKPAQVEVPQGVTAEAAAEEK